MTQNRSHFQKDGFGHLNGEGFSSSRNSLENPNFSENGLITGDSCRKKFGFHFTKRNTLIMTKWVKYCYLALFQSIYFHFWQEKGKLFYQKMPWIKELQKKVWISPKFGFMEKSKSLDFSIMLVFWSLASLVRNSVVLAVYLLFSVACFFTVHEHWSRGCPSRSPPADWQRPKRRDPRPAR